LATLVLDQVPDALMKPGGAVGGTGAAPPLRKRRCDCSKKPYAVILAVYQDNDPSRDMSNADIVRAIRNLEEAVQQGGSPLHGAFHVLNDWRY